MEPLIAYESETSYVWEDDEAPFTLNLPYVPLQWRVSTRVAVQAAPMMTMMQNFPAIYERQAIV